MATTYTQEQINNMTTAQRSAAWHGADKATQDALHAANERDLSATKTYNSTTGAWSDKSSSGGSSGGGGSYTAPANFQGSAVGVQTNTAAQDAIKAQMNANSQAWYSAQTQAEKDALHRQNQALAAQLNLNETNYDEKTGTWSGVSDMPRQPQQQNGGVYTQYLKDMYAQQLSAQLADLKSAYDKNVSAFEESDAAIPIAYQSARNEQAAANEREKQAFNEYAAMRGLNTGTSGQAALAMSSALQDNLGALNVSEREALEKNARAKNDLFTQYNNAIASANANNGAQMNEALYNELVRADESAENARRWQAEYDSTMQQINAANAAQALKDARSVADSMLSVGVVPSGDVLSAAGISFADAQQLARANSAILAAKTKSSGGGSSGGEKKLTASQVLSAWENGYRTKQIAQQMDALFGTNYASEFYEDVAPVKTGVVAEIENQIEDILRAGGSRGNADAALRDALLSELISQQEYAALQKKLLR